MTMKLRGVQEHFRGTSDLEYCDHRTISGEMRLTQSSKVLLIKSLKELLMTCSAIPEGFYEKTFEL